MNSVEGGGLPPPEVKHKWQQGGVSTFPQQVNLIIHVPTVHMINPARWLDELKNLDWTVFNFLWIQLRGSYTSRIQTHVTTRGSLSIPTASRPYYTCSHYAYDEPCKRAWWAQEFGLDCVKFSINSVEGELHLHNSNTCDNKGASQHSHSM